MSNNNNEFRPGSSSGDDVSVTRHESGDVIVTRHESGDVIVTRYDSGDVIVTRRDGGDVSVTRHESGDIIVTRRDGGDVSVTRYDSGDIIVTRYDSPAVLYEGVLLASRSLGETAAAIAHGSGLTGLEQVAFVREVTEVGGIAGWDILIRTAKESDGGKRG